MLRKKAAALILTILIILCALPAGARAADGITYEFAFAVHTISGDQYVRHVGPDTGEDVLHDDTPLPVQRWQILDNARRSLKGENASDYTLAWAVQAMRLVFDGDDSAETLLHAASLARLAYSAAVPGDERMGTEDLLNDAAAALCTTAHALEQRIYGYAVTALGDR